MAEVGLGPTLAGDPEAAMGPRLALGTAPAFVDSGSFAAVSAVHSA